MPQMLNYLRNKLAPREGVHFGRVSCNRVYLSVALYLAYLFLVPHEGGKFDFMVKRILPYVLTILAGYGLYYGILGFMRDANHARAAIGAIMNLICLIFHGIAMYWQTKELFYAYWYDHGQIMMQFR